MEVKIKKEHKNTDFFSHFKKPWGGGDRRLFPMISNDFQSIFKI